MKLNAEWHFHNRCVNTTEHENHRADEFSTKQNWQCWHYWKLCIVIYSYICSFLLHLPRLMLGNVKLEIRRYMRITFLVYKFYWMGWFSMAQLKQVGNVGILVLQRDCEKLQCWCILKVISVSQENNTGKSHKEPKSEISVSPGSKGLINWQV